MTQSCEFSLICKPFYFIMPINLHGLLTCVNGELIHIIRKRVETVWSEMYWLNCTVKVGIETGMFSTMKALWWRSNKTKWSTSSHNQLIRNQLLQFISPLVFFGLFWFSSATYTDRKDTTCRQSIWQALTVLRYLLIYFENI